MILVYIHGANSSSASWNYVRQQLAHDVEMAHRDIQEITLDYNSDHGFDNNLKDMIETINQSETKQKLYFIAHSLGGVYALHLAQEFKSQTVGGFTISTPYGGCESAKLLHIVFPREQLLADISPHSWPIKRIQQFTIPKKWTTVVTTKGDNPLFLGQANDGIVTVRSQQSLDTIDQINMGFNHYEILQSTDLIKRLVNKIIAVI